MTDGAQSYEQSGVREQSDALSAVRLHLGPTLGIPEGAELLTDFGHYASVIKLSADLALAISTDGVGSKTIVASALDRYDTIGFDCVAMNVNDVLCVGARPIAMVDYLGVHTLDARRTDEILNGLGAAAKEAGIAIPGGELAQLPEIIGSDGRTPGDEKAFDLVGTCVGIVSPDQVVLGRELAVGDAIIGLTSSGIHSNGLTLARRVLNQQAGIAFGDHVAEFGRSLGEELLRPTEIYARAVNALWQHGIATKGLAHITSDGMTNLCRLEAPVGYSITDWPEIPAIFDVVRTRGQVPLAEMYRVFNMGVGFVVIVDTDNSEAALDLLGDAGYASLRIGTVDDDVGRVKIKPAKLVGTLVGGTSRFEEG